MAYEDTSYNATALLLEGTALDPQLGGGVPVTPTLRLTMPTGSLMGPQDANMFNDPNYQQILSGLVGDDDLHSPDSPHSSFNSARSTSRSPHLAGALGDFRLDDPQAAVAAFDGFLDPYRRESMPAITVSQVEAAPAVSMDDIAAVPLRPGKHQRVANTLNAVPANSWEWERNHSAPSRYSAPDPTLHNTLFSNTASAGEDVSGSSREASPGPETRRTTRKASASQGRARAHTSPGRSPGTLRRGVQSSPQLRVSPYPGAASGHASGHASEGASGDGGHSDGDGELDRKEARKKYQREWSREKRAAQKKAEEDLLQVRGQLNDLTQRNQNLTMSVQILLTILQEINPNVINDPRLQPILQNLQQEAS
eukprot:m.232245 g.232245  ORF g.232245 m.232245 type:complete len:367 (-) comp18646_c0_seq1:20-1120(-)